jgi:hypothetical protein
VEILWTTLWISHCGDDVRKYLTNTFSVHKISSDVLRICAGYVRKWILHEINPLTNCITPPVNPLSH